jgi:hypothetical protein
LSATKSLPSDIRAGLAACGALLVALAGCVITTEGMQEKDVVLSDVFPPSKTVSSYRQLERPRRATAEELAAQFGGKARLDLMRRWGSFASQVCEYGLPRHRPRVCVSISEMNSRLDAYGAYTNIRPAMLPETQYVRIGVHATLDGERLFFVHDRYLVAVRDLEKSEPQMRRDLLVNFGRAVSSRIPRPITEVEPVSFIPVQNRVLASERLDLDDPLGLGIFDKGAVSAVYRIEDRECRAFAAFASAGWSKRAQLSRLRRAMEEAGPVTETKHGDVGCQGRLLGHPALIAQREDVVFGVLGTFTPEEMRELMAALDRKIKPLTLLKYSDVKKEEEKKEKAGGFKYTP